MNYNKLLEQTCTQINEIMPWDFESYLANKPDALLIDVRESHEFNTLRLLDVMSIPRGILESACSWGFNETVPALAAAKQRPVLLVCRSGHRSAFAALTLNSLGFEHVTSLKLGLKGLNDEEHPIFNADDELLDGDHVERWLNPPVSEQQLAPIKIS